MPVIEVAEFHKVYDGMAAVAGLSFRVNAGEILGLVGPNGAGKTTTMRALSGLIPPSRGDLSICGHDVQREPIAAKTRLAYIPDDPQLFPDLTVAEHLGVRRQRLRDQQRGRTCRGTGRTVRPGDPLGRDRRFPVPRNAAEAGDLLRLSSRAGRDSV